MAPPKTRLTIRALDADLVSAIEPWFDDGEIRSYLGGRDWIRRELHLIDQMPGRCQGGVTIVGRWGWVAFQDRMPVAYVAVERYEDRTASGCLLVAAPARGRGIGRRVLRVIARQPELAGVERLFGGIEPENLPSRRCLAAVGAVIADTPDDEGMLSASIGLSRHIGR